MALFSRLRRAILITLFNGLYRAGHWAYDPLTTVFFGSAWHNWRRTALTSVGPGATLELACGTGQLLEELSERSSLVIGIDRSDSMLAPARKRATIDHVHLIQADAWNLPFGAGLFDTVVTTFPASFVAQRQVLDEIAAVLKPGGTFVVVASARYTRFQWRRPYVHPVLKLAYGASDSMNRWPGDLLAHPELPGNWRDMRTPEGAAFVWVATKRVSERHQAV